MTPLKFAVLGGISLFPKVVRHLCRQGRKPDLLIFSAEKDVGLLHRGLDSLGIETWVTQDIHTETSRLKTLGLDLLVCIEYPQILKKDVLRIPRLGCANLHTSLLPQYRGRHPVTWALIRGEDHIGITLHFMDENIDEGDIVLQDEVPVEKDDDYRDVFAKLVPVGCRMVELGLNQIETGSFYRRKQRAAKATYLRKRMPGDGRINWRESSRSVSRLINALVDPMPNAFARYQGGEVRFTRAYLGSHAGEVLAKTTDGRYVISTGDSVVLVASDRTLKIGTILGQKEKARIRSF